MSDEYWTISHGVAVKSHKCRECKKYIYKGESIVARDGRKIRLIYHTKCFSGQSDIRSQQGAIKAVKDRKYGNVIQATAPKSKGSGKWSTNNYGLNQRANSK